jgi:hypothetical protein
MPNLNDRPRTRHELTGAPRRAPSWLRMPAEMFDSSARPSQPAMFDPRADAMGTPAMFDGTGPAPSAERVTRQDAAMAQAVSLDKYDAAIVLEFMARIFPAELLEAVHYCVPEQATL